MSFEQRRDRGTRADAPGHLSYELREADDGRWQVSLRGPASSEIAARLAGVAPLLDLSLSHDELPVLVVAGRHHDVDRLIRFALEAVPVPTPAVAFWSLPPRYS